MTKIKTVSQVVKGCPLEEPSIPDLTEHKKGFPEKVRTYLKAVQGDALMLTNDTRSTVNRWNGAVDASVCSWLLKAVGALRGGQMFLKAFTTEKFVQY